MLARVAWVVRRHGLVGSIRLIPRKARSLVHASAPAARYARRAERAFDSEFGLDTTREERILSSFSEKSASHANKYQTISVTDSRRLLSGLQIKHEDYTFIDIGAGKGRMLLLASHFPYRQIIGVEFSGELCKIALANLGRYSAPGRRCTDLQIVHADAADFLPPSGPLVVYLYNPFDAEKLRCVIERLEPALIAPSGASLVIYVQPDHRHVLDQSSFLKLEQDQESVLTFRAFGE